MKLQERKYVEEIEDRKKEFRTEMKEVRQEHLEEIENHKKITMKGLVILQESLEKKQNEFAELCMEQMQKLQCLLDVAWKEKNSIQNKTTRL